MRLPLLPYSVGGVLAGATTGQRVLLSLLDECKSAPSKPSVLIIDFSGIELATASFLRESAFALKDHMRSRASNWYPIFANVLPDIEEEFEILTQARSDALILCNCSHAGVVTHRRLFGDLDPKHTRTFELVAREGEVDAGSLADIYGAQEKLQKPTAWNNRLKSLVERGVLMEISKGRAKTYRPAW